MFKRSLLWINIKKLKIWLVFLVFFFMILWFVVYLVDYIIEKENKRIENIKKELLAEEASEIYLNYTIKKSIPSPLCSEVLPPTSGEEIKEYNKCIVNLDVQFYSQSPFWKWWPIFEDTCEEASVLIAINYIKNLYVSREEFRDELLSIVDWENKYFGKYRDTDVIETSEIISVYFWYHNYEIIDDPSIEDIKKELDKWNIIITPVYWVWLNPHFSWVWPDYHFIVIKWYELDKFITHDVWTRHWKNYKYDQKDLLNRIHDFDETSILNWEKKIIVINKN